MGITNVTNGIIQEWGIFDGGNTFTGLTIISDNYDGGFRDIMIFPVGNRKRANL